MSFSTKSAVWVLGVVFIAPVLAYSQENPSADGIAYFETHIRPLFARHCYGCHSERASDQQGELRLDSQEAWLRGGERGPSIIPGDSGASLLMQAVRYDDPELEMPPSEPLSATEVMRLEHWIQMGAPGPAAGSVHVAADPSDPVAGKDHWAFQPLKHNPPPNIQNAFWPRSTIDQFVVARLEHEALQPAPDADRSDLIRRLTFQLIGLPPTRLQVEQFLADDRPDALERFVDQLLNSPRYGERWGRHWLDLARYADSNGLDENFLFREAWRYRNWVIEAVNADMAYDRFLSEQLAGDLLPFESIEQRDRQHIAAGFLVVGPKVLLGIDKQQQRMDVADEHIDTIGRAILGQTLGCARCHDHKFDPIPTADYYALAGIFASTRVMESRYMLNQQRLMEQLVGIGPGGSQADDAYEEYWREQPKRKGLKPPAEAALKSLEDGKEAAFTKLLEDKPDAIAEGAKNLEASLEERIACQADFVAELTQWLAKPLPIPPRAMIPADVDEPADEAIRLAGQFDDLGETVPRGFLTVLSDDRSPQIPKAQSGRIALAQWLTDSDGQAGQLAAHVFANRVWHHLIGRGLVRTVDNLGRTGEEPTHPELLDYLAGRLLDSGWSVKALVREIVLSRTFALSSRYDAAGDAVDPENRLLWRAHRRRLDAESLRDAILSAADLLDVTPVDSTVSYLGDQATAVGANKVRRRTDFSCRSVYLPVIRNDLPELFEAFDFANPHTTTGARPKTTVPTQGLFMLNDEMVMDAAEKLADRISQSCATGDMDARIAMMFELILNARPADRDCESLRRFLQQTEQQLRLQADDQPEVHALAMACHAVLASSRFQFLE